MTSKYKQVRTNVSSTILELRKDTEALKLLSDLVELVDVPPERGGVYFSDWEKQFIKSLGELESPIFTEAQQEKLREVWHSVDLRKRGKPDEKVANLFSNLSPARRAEQLARAAKVKLPWEK